MYQMLQCVMIRSERGGELSQVGHRPKTRDLTNSGYIATHRGEGLEPVAVLDCVERGRQEGRGRQGHLLLYPVFRKYFRTICRTIF
jgi:hypothetical protein